MTTSRFYRESGRYDGKGAAIVVLGSALAGALLGFVYGIVSQVNPIIYVNFLFMIGLAFAVAFAGSRAQGLGKVRSSMVNRVGGAVGGLVALYAAWVGWCWALTSWKLFLVSPGSLWSFAGFVNTQGAWSIKGATPTGTVLWCFWAVEAAVILGGCALLAVGNDLPFCEDCGEWAGEERVAHLTPAESTEALVDALQGEDYGGLLALARIAEDAAARYVATASRCPEGSDGPFFLTLEAKVRRPNGKGEVEESGYELLRHLYVTAPVYEFIAAGGGPAAAPEADPKAKAEAGGREEPASAG